MAEREIGIIGLGSIGQRHLSCLKELGIDTITALRTQRGSHQGLSDEFHYVREIFSERKFYSHAFDGIIISNPTSLHIKTLKSALNQNVPVFVEKPLADSIRQLDEIRPEDRSRVMVGFCLRFHKMIRLVKDFIDAGGLGKISRARLYCGHYLPLWHPDTDYRREYFSRRDLGGGVLRTLSHELDLSRYFFGDIRELTGFSGKLSDLEIDVEDTAFFLGTTDRGITVSVELDYLNPRFCREGILIGSQGSLAYSFNPPELVFSGSDGATHNLLNNEIRHDINNFYHDMYREQMKNFLNFVEGTEKPMCDFADGAYVMRLIKAIEDSSRLKAWQKLAGGVPYGSF